MEYKGTITKNHSKARCEIFRTVRVPFLCNIILDASASALIALGIMQTSLAQQGETKEYATSTISETKNSPNAKQTHYAGPDQSRRARPKHPVHIQR